MALRRPRTGRNPGRWLRCRGRRRREWPGSRYRSHWPRGGPRRCRRGRPASGVAVSARAAVRRRRSRRSRTPGFVEREEGSTGDDAHEQRSPWSRRPPASGPAARAVTTHWVDRSVRARSPPPSGPTGRGAAPARHAHAASSRARRRRRRRSRGSRRSRQGAVEPGRVLGGRAGRRAGPTRGHGRARGRRPVVVAAARSRRRSSDRPSAASPAPAVRAARPRRRPRARRRGPGGGSRGRGSGAPGRRRG